MKRTKIIIGGIIVLLIGLGIVAFINTGGFSASSGSGDSDDAAAPENVTNIVTVQVGALTNVTLHRYVDAYGMVEAAPATAGQPAAGGPLVAPVAGIVSKINVVPGQQVKQGDLLMTVDSATAAFDYAQMEVQRQKDLYSHQNTSLKNLQDAQALLDSLELTAPVSGTVTAVNVKPGQSVDMTTVAVEVIDLKRLAVSVKVPAARGAELQEGQEVQVQADPPVSASLSFVSPAVDAADGTILAWAALPPDNTLRPGQFVQLKIVTATHTNSLAVPAASVVTDDDGNSTIARVNGNEADQTSVQTGFREGNWVEIQATNLNADDKVVTVGAYGLADKTQIQIQNTPDETSATNSADAK